MGQNDQDGKYALFVSLFVSFHGDLEARKKSTQLTSTLKTETAWLCFYSKWAKFSTINS